MKRDRVFRGAILLLLFFVLIFLWLTRLPVAYLPKWVSCDGDVPVWLTSLSNEVQQFGYPGFQISVESPLQGRIDCAVGWAGSTVSDMPLRTTDTMRYASLSKIFTSVVILQLIDEGKLELHTRLIDALDVSPPFFDDRVADISIKHLLSHTAGFDRSKSPDPMLDNLPWCPGRLEELKIVDLDFFPGRDFAYSNIGYCLLGEVIRKIEGRELGDVFNDRLFKPANVRSIFALDNVNTFSGRKIVDVADSVALSVPEHPRSHLASGAWAGTAKELADILVAIFGSSNKLLADRKKKDILNVYDRCSHAWRGCHGLGFYRFREFDGPIMYWRDGSLPNTSAFVAVMSNDVKIVFLANGRSVGWLEANDKIGKFFYRLGII